MASWRDARGGGRFCIEGQRGVYARQMFSRARGAAGATSCGGCCISGLCVGTQFQNASLCGVNGKTCSPCNAMQLCVSGVGGGGGGFSQSGPGSCAGCCIGGVCLDPLFENALDCGLNGKMCGACASGEVCAAGFSLDGGAVGSPCSYDGQCQPPSNGLCIPQSVVGNSTGWPGGYCTASCAMTACGPGSSCINAANASGVANWLCFHSCVGPRTGQSTCRSNYLCEFDLGNPTGLGVCFPRCDSPGFTCWSGTVCSPLTGYCMSAGPK